LPYALRGIQLDPNFALAYLIAGEDYLNMGQPGKAAEYISRAFELQDHADARQRLQIASTYYYAVTGELNKVAQTYQNQVAIEGKHRTGGRDHGWPEITCLCGAPESLNWPLDTMSLPEASSQLRALSNKR
jgi:tetratricopeptide (TPR) repeat protein